MTQIDCLTSLQQDTRDFKGCKEMSSTVASQTIDVAQNNNWVSAMVELDQPEERFYRDYSKSNSSVIYNVLEGAVMLVDDNHHVAILKKGDSCYIPEHVQYVKSLNHHGLKLMEIYLPAAD